MDVPEILELVSLELRTRRTTHLFCDKHPLYGAMPTSAMRTADAMNDDYSLIV
jgi:hypothetical protein